MARMSETLKLPMRQPSLSTPMALMFLSAMSFRASRAAVSGGTVSTGRLSHPRSLIVAWAKAPREPMFSYRYLMMSVCVMMLVRVDPSSPNKATRWMWSSPATASAFPGATHDEGLRNALQMSSMMEAFSACLLNQKPPSPPLTSRSFMRMWPYGFPASSRYRIRCSMLLAMPGSKASWIFVRKLRRMSLMSKKHMMSTSEEPSEFDTTGAARNLCFANVLRARETPHSSLSATTSLCSLERESTFCCCSKQRASLMSTGAILTLSCCFRVR
mmetsp:Transcript_16406/g.45725  ORF Transcript_16406/g.45725 Transcript_16406/m.45725 type:complete len:272 (+) Transcript_16406:539-1354(+)